MNKDVNIFVGENDSGKSTILEVLAMVLTGKMNGRKIDSLFNLDWFNFEIRNEFKEALKANKEPKLPSIEIEAYLESRDDEITIKKFKGTNNSLHEDSVGVKLTIDFDYQYTSAYKELLSSCNIQDIPIEYYRVSFNTFSSSGYYAQATTKKVSCIDTTKKDYGTVLSRFVSNSINEYLNEGDLTELRHAYRVNRQEFIQNDTVRKLNQELENNQKFNDKKISLYLREAGIDEWKDDMTISLDDIPLENFGFGTQNMFKIEIFLRQNSNVDILIIEEPENNLSYTNMSILISKMQQSKEKQLFISTHSSFVANKLGLQCLQLVSNHSIVSFQSLRKDTYDYFLKLPGYNTLRLLLANKAILVEGPADELIMQRAYIDNYGKLPIEDGIDVISVGGVAFQRYCELADIIKKHITIVTDNDGNHDMVVDRYKKFDDLVMLCVESDDKLNTLEPSVLAVNEDNFESFRSIIYQGKDMEKKSKEDIKTYMIKNKTDWSMRVFTSNQRVNYPKYILKAIGINNE